MFSRLLFTVSPPSLSLSWPFGFTFDACCAACFQSGQRPSPPLYQSSQTPCCSSSTFAPASVFVSAGRGGLECVWGVWRETERYPGLTMEMEMLVPPGLCVSPWGSEETYGGALMRRRGSQPVELLLRLRESGGQPLPLITLPFLLSPRVTLPGEQWHNDRWSEHFIKYSTESFLSNINFPPSGKNG